MKQLKNCIKLRSHVKIYVPSTVDVDVQIDSSKTVDTTLIFLSEKFGGATATEALGAWMTASGNLVKEKVTLCLSYCDELSLSTHIDSVYEYCLRMKLNLKQESIALEVNGELYFI